MVTPRPLTVSVAMATYNGERFIREQLESIGQQTRLPTQIVISDDGSVDQTLAVIAQVLTKDYLASRGMTLVLLRDQENLGTANNFRRAIEACTGDVIALTDQDDVWEAGKLDTLVALLESDHDILLVHSDARLIDASGRALPMTLAKGLGISPWEQGHLTSRHSLGALIKRNLVAGATAVFRRELAELAYRKDTQDLHDTRLALVASLLDGLRYVPQELIEYRQHDSNQIGGKPLGLLDSVVAVMKSWVELSATLTIRTGELRSLLEDLGDQVPEGNQVIARERIAHNEWRAGLPHTRILRVWAVLGGVVRGRYRRFGRAPHDVIRDLVMPPHEVALGLIRRVAQIFSR